MILGMVSDAVAQGAPETQAAALLGLSARTLQRWREQDTGDDRRLGPKSRPRNQLSDHERKVLLATVNAPRFRDLSPSVIGHADPRELGANWRPGTARRRQGAARSGSPLPVVQARVRRVRVLRSRAGLLRPRAPRRRTPSLTPAEQRAPSKSWIDKRTIGINNGAQ
ncbi:helix-turn-helix domain-containing protein [Sorangium sp. So ce1097]|uniref:helix-turn-helix domain-containing protein n=1 Tax=Sorangium sp. So ce1097 TaxID=3133330 RepID=UPI003F5FCDFB